jgi:hypothetical protein
MRKLVAVIVPAVALGVAGAAAVGAPSPAREIGSAGRRAAVSEASPEQVVRANRRAAAGAADQLLDELVMPSGATEVQSEPPGDAHQLSRAMQLSFFAAQVDRHEFWRTSASPAAVAASIEARPPAGARWSGSGYSGTTEFVSYSLPAIGTPALGQRTVSVVAVKLSGGGTGVRADATVRYSAPRLPGQRVPAQARVLEVAMTPSPFGPAPAPTLKTPLVVSKRSQVRRIAALVDGLPFLASLSGVAISCPAILPAPTVTFTFRGAPAGAALATVSEPADTPAEAEPCFATALTISGHRQPSLLEGGKLLREAGAILSVKLATRR